MPIVHRHLGASFQDGADVVHVVVPPSAWRAVTAAWRRWLSDPGLAQPLVAAPEAAPGAGWATTYPFLPLPLVQRLVAFAAAGRRPDRALQSELGRYAYDAAAYEGAWGRHRAQALARGWPTWPLLVGFMPALILGCGRRHRLVAMNLAPRTSPLLALGGGHKGVGRALLQAYGLPVAPGALVESPRHAVDRAQQLGWPVVIKRLSGGNSDGVITGIADAATCRAAARELMVGQYAVLVERELAGVEFRAHLVNGRIVEVLRRDRVVVRGDGHRTLRELLGEVRARMLEMAAGSPWIRRKLVYQLWSAGVRHFRDLDRIVPPPGAAHVVGLTFEADTGPRAGRDALHPADMAAIERFLNRHGAPGGGLDLILREPGAPLAEGGGILEINVPSGFWYVRDPDAVAQAELDAIAAQDADFAAHRGRVPFWVVPVGGRGMPVPDAIRARFAAEYPGGAEVALPGSDDGRDPWPSVLTRDADALLLPLSDQEVQRYGFPMHLAPTVWISGHAAGGESAPLAQTHPLLAAVLPRAGQGVREVSA